MLKMQMLSEDPKIWGPANISISHYNAVLRLQEHDCEPIC